MKLLPSWSPKRIERLIEIGPKKYIAVTQDKHGAPFVYRIDTSAGFVERELRVLPQRGPGHEEDHKR